MPFKVLCGTWCDLLVERTVMDKLTDVKLAQSNLDKVCWKKKILLGSWEQVIVLIEREKSMTY